jgi:dTDP-4-dehydrorhamnose reductase
MRVFITGAGGQLGRELVDCFERDDHHEVIAATHQHLDVSARDEVLGLVTATQPDAVVHAAAWTAVDDCESDPDRAFAVNTLGARHIADAAGRVGASVCYVSTDYVFDGSKASPYVEWDDPAPASVYGRSKLAGEREQAAGATIVRTSWVCGYHGANMVKTILRLSAEHEQLRFVDDQRGHPTFADDLASMIKQLVVERRPGLFHVTNQGAVSWFEFAQEVLRLSGQDPERVHPVSTVDLKPPRPAPRPANSVLDNAALRNSGLALLPDFREPLERLLKRLADDQPASS